MFAPIPHGSFQAIRLHGANLAFTEGSQLTARVVKQLGGGRVLLSIQGKSFAADTRLPLLAGQRLDVQVQVRGSTVFLRLSGNQSSPVPSFLRSEGLTADRLSQSIVHAFMRSGLPLDGAAIRSARRALSHRGEPDQRLIRMYAIARDKGIELDADELSELSRLLDGSPADDRGQRKERERPRRRGTGSGDPPEGAESEDAQGEGAAAAPDPAALLRLFNHSGGSTSHWVILPIAFSREGRPLSGSLRLLLDRYSKELRLACVTVRGGAIEFDVAWRKGSSAAQLYTDQGETVQEYLGDIARCLEPLGVSDIAVHRWNGEWDGFATDVQGNIMYGVDERA